MFGFIRSAVVGLRVLQRGVKVGGPSRPCAARVALAQHWTSADPKYWPLVKGLNLSNYITIIGTYSQLYGFIIMVT